MRWFTIEEHFKYNADQFPEGFIEEHESFVEEEVKKAVESRTKEVNLADEIREEQLQFAKQAIDNIEQACRQYTNAKELKKAIAEIISNSMFER